MIPFSECSRGDRYAVATDWLGVKNIISRNEDETHLFHQETWRDTFLSISVEIFQPGCTDYTHCSPVDRFPFKHKSGRAFQRFGWTTKKKVSGEDTWLRIADFRNSPPLWLLSPLLNLLRSFVRSFCSKMAHLSRRREIRRLDSSNDATTTNTTPPVTAWSNDNARELTGGGFMLLPLKK